MIDPETPTQMAPHEAYSLGEAIPTTEHTVDELIVLWQSGLLDRHDAEIIWNRTMIEFEFQATDGCLKIPYMRADECAERSDKGRQNRTREFDISEPHAERLSRDHPEKEPNVTLDEFSGVQDGCPDP